jgi:hypothetical protein
MSERPIPITEDNVQLRISGVFHTPDERYSDRGCLKEHNKTVQ